MNVNELIERLESCDGEQEVYTIGVGGEYQRVIMVDSDVPHENLSIAPYEEENFVLLQ